MAILTSTKLLVMICWYFSRTLGSVIKFLANRHTLDSSCGLFSYKTVSTNRRTGTIFQQGVKVKNHLFNISEASIFLTPI